MSTVEMDWSGIGDTVHGIELVITWESTEFEEY